MIFFKIGFYVIVLVSFIFFGILFVYVVDKEIFWIYCGDKIDLIYEKYIKEWEGKNVGWKVKLEVVGWEQCQDKVMMFVVVGMLVVMVYVGLCIFKEFVENDMIVLVLMMDDEKKSYYLYIVDIVIFKGIQWGVLIVFFIKVFYWNKDFFKKVGFDLEILLKIWVEEIVFVKQIKEKIGMVGYGLLVKIFDNIMYQFMYWVYINNGKMIDGDKVVVDSLEVFVVFQVYKDIMFYFVEGVIVYEQNEICVIFLDGKVGMIQVGLGVVLCLKKINISWGIVILLFGLFVKGLGMFLIMDLFVIFKGLGVEDKVVEFVKFIIFFGLQGEYELQGDVGLMLFCLLFKVDEFVKQDLYWKLFIEGIFYGGLELLFKDYKGFQNVVIEMVQFVVIGKVEFVVVLKKVVVEMEQYK